MLLALMATGLSLAGPTAELRVLQRWAEAEVVLAGDPYPGNGHELMGWNLNRKAPWGWTLTGELTSARYQGLHISTAHQPWRLDIVSRESIRPAVTLLGIFRFEGDRLVWTTNWSPRSWFDVAPLVDHPGRPTEFISTKKNGYSVIRLDPAEHDWQRVFPAPKPPAPAKKP